MNESLTSLCLCFTCLIICAESSKDQVPKFIKIFEKHQEWGGHYEYNNTKLYTMLLFHSGYSYTKQGVIGTFKDKDGATLDVKGEQVGNNELFVRFETSQVFKGVNRFPHNFTFEGELKPKQDSWIFEGTVIIPENGTFGSINYNPTDSVIGPFFDDDSSLAWRYTLIIGVPIVLALVGVIGTVYIIYWAIKKGYIRHVPKSYDSFNSSAVRYENNKDNVHI